MNRNPNATAEWAHPSRFRDTTRSETVETTQIVGGRIVTPDDVIDGGVLRIRDGTIERILHDPDRRTHADTTVDATGKVVMPGLIDLHGDDIERHLFPRPEARVDTAVALTSADRTSVVNGITTKFHAIAFENAPGDNRAISLATELVETIDAATELLADNRVHVRCELTESVRAVRELLDSDISVGLVSLMNHVPGDGQFVDQEAFEERYVDGQGYSTESAQRLADCRQNTTESVLWYRISELAEHANDAGVPVASHDDDSPEFVDRMASQGVCISEFPVTIDAARRAAEHGLYSVMGAPNLVRGGSLWDNLAVEDAVDEGVVDVLCSDYHPPSLLAAPFVPTGEPLPKRVARVTSNPADAVGLDDRGRIEEGLRADVLVVDPEPIPTVQHVFANGQNVFRTTDQDRQQTQNHLESAS